MRFKQDGVISTLSGKLQKFVNQFTYLESKISSIENDLNLHKRRVWVAIDRVLIISKFDISDKIIRDFFQTVIVSVLLYGFPT